MPFLESLHPDYTAFPQNQETLRTEKNYVSILVKKSLLFSISYLSECETDRIIGLKISTPTTSPVYLFWCLFNNVDAYKHYISMLWDIWNLFYELGDVIIVCDYNARYAELPTSYVHRAKSRLLTDFIQSNDISPLNKTDKCSGLGYTFSTNCSTIDYILVNQTLLSTVEHCEVIRDSDIDITSDHLLLFCTLSLPIQRFFPRNNFSLSALNKATCGMLMCAISYHISLM